MQRKLKSILLFVLLTFPFFQLSAQIPASTKPFTRWWWMGNAVSKEGIKYNLEAFQKAGLGGVEITPIYGVKGQEDNFIPFLSPKYLEMLNYTTSVADSLGLKVDMVLGTGWPYGGPQVEPEYAASRLAVDSFTVKRGEYINRGLTPPDEFAQLIAVMAYGANGETKDISAFAKDGINLKWSAPDDSDYEIYAIYCGKTGQKVKRAAPGGAGFTLDHYSREALNDYLKPFDSLLTSTVRAVFNDSYEVYGTDFTPTFLEEFEKRRGYDLKPFLPLLIHKVDNAKANRIRSDYRETLSDLLKENFNRPWTSWAHQKGYQTKLQAHGSPGNLLDLYATADIPECETFGSMPFEIPGLRREAEDIRQGDADPVMLKFSSSAGHVMGKPLISSESFTWLRDHFKVALSQCKPELEELLLNGVNHVFLHGSTYSPPEAEWPGWKFYASVNFSPQMPVWKDSPALFSYIKNCQEWLQKGRPDNEIGVYWPIYDTWQEYLGGELFFQFKIHSLNEWLLHTPFYKTSTELMKAGYSVDFFSDEFLENTVVENGLLKTPGGIYKALVVPQTTCMPLNTLNQLLKLKASGGRIYFEEVPEGVPGYGQLEERKAQFEELKSGVHAEAFSAILKSLQSNDIKPETLATTGLKFIRRVNGKQKIYYIVNHTSADFDGTVNLNSTGNEVMLFDPEGELKGKVSAQSDASGISLRIQLKAGQSLILVTHPEEELMPWNYYEETGEAIPLTGPFDLKYIEGGPALPQPRHLTRLQSWTKLGPGEEAFSGTAKYSFTFDRPKGKSTDFMLQLPDVRESARVWLNGNYVGTLWANPFECRLSDLKKKDNKLEIEVTNLAANRIRAKEMSGEEWKIFYEINMVNKDYQVFDATKWSPMPSGLIGEIKLQPLKAVH